MNKNVSFSVEEREAMRERAKELKAESKVSKSRSEGESAVREKIAEMPKTDRVLAEKIHKIVTSVAPGLMPRTWYGMPAYANEDGKVVCFFQSADKFKARYATFGFSDVASLDKGEMWPSAFALTSITKDVDKKIEELVKRAVQ